MERVLITGGTGFVGRATVRLLLERGFAVRVLTRGPWPFEPHPRLERANGGMTNSHSLLEAARDCGAVVHLAARKNDERDSEAVNVDGTRALCDAAKKGGANRIVYVSTQSAALKKRGLYGETKLRGENIVKTSALPYVILRPSLVYGASDAGVFATIKKLCRLPFVPVFGNGRAVFRPIHVDDLAEAIVAAMEKPTALGATLDIGGPTSIPFDELIRTVQRMAGVERRILHLPAWIGLTGATVLGILPRPFVTKSNVRGGMESTHMDTETANELLKIHPRPFHPKPDVERSADADATTILSYVSSGAVTATPELTERFRAACVAHGITIFSMPPRRLLPYVDAAACLWHPNGSLRRALLAAAAVAECTPDGAEAFLPKRSTPSAVILRTIGICLLAAWYAVAGTLLWAIPSVRRHAA